MTFSFFVPGHPEPAGSKRAFMVAGHANVVDANPKASKWKLFVAACGARCVAKAGLSMPVESGPVGLTLRFTLLRPKGHLGTGRNVGVVKDSAPSHPTVKPDLLKLARGVEDALTGILYLDDAQIVLEVLGKRYGLTEGVEVEIEPIPTAPAPAPSAASPAAG